MPRQVIVIGGGPGGYAAALRAAELGAGVTLFERESLGGTCVNQGCIPTKAWLRLADLMDGISRAREMGLNAGQVSIDVVKARTRVKRIVAETVSAMTAVLATQQVTILTANAQVLSPCAVAWRDDSGRAGVAEAGAIIVATGSEPTQLNIPGYDLDGVISGDASLDIREVPQSTLVIGGGAIGVEMAYIHRGLGSKVTLVEIRNQLVSWASPDFAGALCEAMRALGIEVLLHSSVGDIRSAGRCLEALVSGCRGTASGTKILCDKVIVAAGRRPRTRGSGLEATGVKTTPGGFVRVDEHMRTTVPGVWAVGDVTGIMMLAHVAAAQGRCAAEDAMGLRSSMSYDVVPVCLYSRPELSKVGLSQDEAERDGRRVVTGRAHFSLNGGAVAQGDSSAMAEVVCDAGSEEVIGAQIIGPGATELIAEAASIIAMQGRIGEWAGIIHAHPTLSEVLQQAAESARRSLKLL